MTGPAVPSGLDALLAQATRGEWKAENGSTYLAGRGWWVDGPETLSHDGDMVEADARLIALAPDAVRLLIDMAATLGEVPHVLEGLGAFIPGAAVEHAEGCLGCKAAALLARFAAVDQRAGTA